jgi:hypothetical protein
MAMQTKHPPLSINQLINMIRAINRFSTLQSKARVSYSGTVSIAGELDLHRRTHARGNDEDVEAINRALLALGSCERAEDFDRDIGLSCDALLRALDNNRQDCPAASQAASS